MVTAPLGGGERAFSAEGSQISCLLAGLGELEFETIQSAPIDLRPAFCKSILLSGGSTMFPGLSTRLEKEVRARSVGHAPIADREKGASPNFSKAGLEHADEPVIFINY